MSDNEIIGKNIEKNAENYNNEELKEHSEENNYINNTDNVVIYPIDSITEEILNPNMSLDTSENVNKENISNKIVDLKTEIKIEDDADNYDAYGDGTQIYRNYQLRRDRKKVDRIQITEYRKRSKIIDTKYLETDGIPEFFCDTCNLQLTTKKGFSVHVKKHAPKKMEYNCLLCDGTFQTNLELIQHKAEHKSERRTFVCKCCCCIFSDHFDFIMHNLLHETKDKYKCLECGNAYNTKTGYRMHLFSHENRAVECEVCHLMVRSALSLPAHMKTHDDNKIKCGECGKECKTKKVLDYHMTSHTGVKAYQCLYCARGFANNVQRVVHTRIHTGEKPYQCDTCYRPFRLSSDLEKHKKTHLNSSRFKCQDCTKSFRHLKSLEEHQRLHTRQNLFKCPDCDKAFQNMKCLQAHALYVHIKIKQFSCNICNLEFMTKVALTRHFKGLKHRNEEFRVNKDKKLFN